MTRLLVDPTVDFDDGGTGPVTLTATLLDPTPATVRTFSTVDISTVVELPAPAVSAAWRLTVRRPRTTVNRWGLSSIDPGPIVEERTVRFPDGNPIAWAALTDVDPATLRTTAVPGAAWDAAIAELRTEIAQLPVGGGGGFSGNYSDLTGLPTIPASPADIGAEPAGTADARIAALIDGAPEALDTLKELADQLATDEGLAAALATAAASRVQPGPSIVLENGDTVRYDPARPINPTSTIAVWGHSFADSNGGVMETELAALLGVPVLNRGVGGNTSTDIAIRKGGIVPLITVTGGQIPADTTAVAVTVTPAGPYLVGNTGAYSYQGTLASIPGTLTYTISTGTWTFTRTTAGTATPVPAQTPFLIMTPTDNDAVSIFGLAARNNLYASSTDLSTVIRDLDAQIGTLIPYQPRYLVLSDFTTLAETSSAPADSYDGVNRAKILASNAARAARYGDRYYDIRADFIGQGLALAGITPTTADLAAIAADTSPPSLLGPDSAHPNDAGYRVMARLVADRMVAKGWGAIVTGPQNLLTLNEASIETDASGWSGNGDGAIIVARSTADAVHGSASLLVTGGAGSQNVILPSPGKAVTVGQNYGITVKTRSVATARIRQIEFYWYDASHGFLAYDAGAGVADTTTGWTTVTASGVAPAGAAFLRFGVAASGTTAGEQWRLDAAGLYAIAVGAPVPEFTAPAG